LGLDCKGEAIQRSLGPGPASAIGAWTRAIRLNLKLTSYADPISVAQD